jgi:murein peptide amidase A
MDNRKPMTMNSTLSEIDRAPSELDVVPGADLDQLLAAFNEVAEKSSNVIPKPFGSFKSGSREYSMPRYIYLGPRGGGDTIRIGIFAGIHGDEPQGSWALQKFVSELERNPDLARGYAIFIYPVCNPTGLEDGTRLSRGGVDLNREFWRGSNVPEVKFLETEIWTHAFHGIINLHSDDTSDGLYGFVDGTVLSEHLLEPALRAAEAFLPRNNERRIDGFCAKRGIIWECYQGVLRSPAGLVQPPFEITLETPHAAQFELQVEALNAALVTVLTEYRSLMAVAQNI